MVGLLMTITGVLNQWRHHSADRQHRWTSFYQRSPETWSPETAEDRQRFVRDWVPSKVRELLAFPHNRQLSLLIGVFYPDHLEQTLFRADGETAFKSAPYASRAD